MNEAYKKKSIYKLKSECFKNIMGGFSFHDKAKKHRNSEFIQ